MLKQLAYDNFDIRFDGAPKRGTWRARADSGEGGATGEFQPPHGDRLTSVLDNAPWADSATLEQYGKTLFESLFVAEVRALFATSFKTAKEKGRGLRVRVSTEADLSLIPWEAMWRTDIDVPLAPSEWHPVVRFVHLPFPTEPLAINGPLRVLLVSALPDDQELLDVDAEADKIATTLKTLSGHVDIVRLAQADKLALVDAMKEGAHIVHFMVHGRLDAANGGELMLRAKSGASEPLSATELRELAHDWALNDTRLVVFNSCDTGRARQGDPFSATAAAVVQGGMPAVISMQYPITDVAAGLFSHELYRSLAQGCPVDQAMSQARKIVRLQVKDGQEWITPVLHMRATDGVLFQGSIAPIPRADMQRDPAAQQALVAATQRTAQPAATANEMVIEVNGGRIDVRLAAGAAPEETGDAEAPGDKYAKVLSSPAAPTKAMRELERIAGEYGRILQQSPVTTESLRGLGESLYNAAFAGPAGALLDRTRTSSGLNLRIVADSALAVGLPWEALFDPRKETFLALAGGKRPMRIELADVDRIVPERLTTPVRGLFVGSQPMDMPTLDIEREWTWLQLTLKDTPDLTMDVLMDPTPAEWLAKMSEHEYHILHFAGYDTHAMSGFTEDEGVILLGERGERRDVVKDDLVQLLQGFTSLRLVVMNTCFTARSLSPALLRCGVPSVVAWRGFNDDRIAVRFTSLFYALLKKTNWRVDAALAETRRLLYAEKTDYVPAPWHGPALFTAIEGNDFFGI